MTSSVTLLADLIDNFGDAPAARGRLLPERARIARLSRIRELVLGFQDGLLVPLGVVTGLASAATSSTIVVVGGLAEAGTLAMGTAPTSPARPRPTPWSHP